MDEAKRLEVPLERLHAPCDAASLGFGTTRELDIPEDAVGQEDAIEAIEFGLGMTGEGYNLFLLGSSGTGKRTFLLAALRERAAGLATPPDWCYVNDFADPRRPVLLELPAGGGVRFGQDLSALVESLRRDIPQELEGEEVSSRRHDLVDGRAQAAHQLLDEFRTRAEGDPLVALVGEDGGLRVVGARGGEPIRREAFLTLPEDLRQQIDDRVRETRGLLQTTQRRIQDLEREAGARVAELHREVAARVVDRLVRPLRERYRSTPAILAHFDRLAEDVLDHTERFAMRPGEGPAGAMLLLGADPEELVRRYRVNVFVSHDAGAGAPVVEEPNPTLANLFGRTERQLQLGAMVTDFTRITAGSVQRGNGGFLVLDAAELLSRPFAWGALKRALRTGELQPADAATELGVVTAESLEPQPIPADLKVVLLGEPRVYYLLRALDPDFEELFKVKVDFADRLDHTPLAEKTYAALVAGRCRSEGLVPFDASAVAAVIDEGARRSGDQKKLTARFSEIADLVREAAREAAGQGRSVAGAEDVASAIARRERREQRPFRELLELTDRGVLAFEPRGEVAGQVHGIGLIQLGGEPFGRPIRVMASAYMGTGGIVNLEREARLSGPLHNKGFLVLAGYLGRRFAHARPLILSASLSFDQMYEEVEGDSASVAELYALLSAISGVSLDQGVAVTGALNQDGLVLPVGGVTQKVEGFFAACERVGLTGRQGVLLPSRNLDNLVLRSAVRDAVARGMFHVWAVDRVEEGWPVLSGRSAGLRDRGGSYPDGTVYGAVDRQLAAWAGEWTRLRAPGEWTGPAIAPMGAPEPMGVP